MNALVGTAVCKIGLRSVVAMQGAFQGFFNSTDLKYSVYALARCFSLICISLAIYKALL